MPRSTAGCAARLRDWEALKRAYEVHEGDLELLAIENGLTLDSLQRYARRNSWRRPNAAPRPPPPLRLEAIPGAITQASLDVLLVRLFNAISMKLHQLETSMQDDKRLAPSDHERQTRMIGALTKNTEKVHELSRPGAAEAGDVGHSGAKTDASGNNAEQVRRELAARIQRLRERSVG